MSPTTRRQSATGLTARGLPLADVADGQAVVLHAAAAGPPERGSGGFSKLARAVGVAAQGAVDVGQTTAEGMVRNEEQAIGTGNEAIVKAVCSSNERRLGMIVGALCVMFCVGVCCLTHAVPWK